MISFFSTLRIVIVSIHCDCHVRFVCVREMRCHLSGSPSRSPRPGCGARGPIEQTWGSEVLGSRDAHINRRDATANTMRVARVCYRGPHASCLIAACSLLILMADAAADSETPWRGLPSVALGQSATGRRGPGAKAMRVTITRPYAMFSDLTRSHAISRARYAPCAP